MQINWTSKALGDLGRLHAFLAEVNPPAAAKVVVSITDAVDRLPRNPRLGVRLDEFEPEEVRRIIVGQYEVRYSIADGVIYVLRIWSTREDR